MCVVRCLFVCCCLELSLLLADSCSLRVARCSLSGACGVLWGVVYVGWGVLLVVCCCLLCVV